VVDDKRVKATDPSRPVQLKSSARMRDIEVIDCELRLVETNNRERQKLHR
jgi:hypothetical protein